MWMSNSLSFVTAATLPSRGGHGGNPSSASVRGRARWADGSSSVRRSRRSAARVGVLHRVGGGRAEVDGAHERRVVMTPRAQAASESPDYENGFDPAGDADYDEVRAYSFGPARDGCALVTLRPVAGGDRAFKMSVTSTQADAVRRALRANITLPRGGGVCGSGVYMDRPSTHDFTKSVLDACGAVVAQAAITHIRGDVFIARVWLRTSSATSSSSFSTANNGSTSSSTTPPPSSILPPTSHASPFASAPSSTPFDTGTHHSLIHVDARPSDALALAVRARAPLFLNRHLLHAWGVPVSAVASDAQHGLCEVITYPDAAKSARSLRQEITRRPHVFRLALLQARLDLAVRTQRFKEAQRIQNHINDICPVDLLSHQLARAIDEQRFADAAKLQDELTLWKARLHLWQKGTINLDLSTDSDCPDV